MRKILLGIDHSEHSVRAWQFYKEHIRRADDELLVVHCIELPYQGVYPMRAEVVQDLLDKAQREGQVAEIKFKQILQNNGVNYKLISDFGRPGEMIVSLAGEHQVSMVILGTRGMGKLRRTVLGSVSDYVIHHAHCPVVVARQ